jgi:DNA helicase-4
MLTSCRSMRYVSVFFGFVFLSLAIVSGLFSANNESETPTSLFSILAYPFLACGLVFVSGGIVFFWVEYSGFRKLQLITRTKIQEKVLDKTREIQRWINEIRDSGTYLIYSNKESVFTKIENIRNEIDAYATEKMLGADFVNNLGSILNECTEQVSKYNQDFIQQRKREYAYLWSKEKILLDDEQKTAVVTDDKYNLVVASAGSGKTEVLITRIVYLITRKPDGVNPNKILAIAYQNKDAKQIKKRLEKYGIFGVNVRTFHSLGLDILKSAGNPEKTLPKNERPEIIKSIFESELRSSADFNQKLFNYITSIHDVDEQDLIERNRSLKVKRVLPYTSLNNIRVKSRAEKEIFDFLLANKLNGHPVRVAYENEVENVGKPDFYLPDYDLYIEHWGLTKKGKVPEWFDQSTEEYLENKEKKKQWFEQNGKLLVETYTFEYDEAHPEIFLDLLSKRIAAKLQERNKTEFHFEAMSYQELIDVVRNSDNDWISGDCIANDIGNFIKNAKTYNLTQERILQKLEERYWTRKQKAFAKLAVPVYKRYQEKLGELKKHDFEDMINKSIHELSTNKELCKNVYDHILVDEYQDITHQTNKLIKSLLANNSECKLFCVGDDWQSIMGFAGSNLEFFVNFEKYYENPAITKISTNYRSVKRIVDAGTSLMKNNESCQREKTVASKKVNGKPIKILVSPHQLNYRKNYHYQIAQDCINRVDEYLRNGYANKDILILSRFMWIHSNGMPRYHCIIENLISEAAAKNIKISDDARDERQIRVLTVHKAKGLEARVVFILNVIKDLYGFPCEIEDTSILEPARENYPHQNRKEEERRLFYVALSRAKEDLNIYSWEPSISEFLEEINNYTVKERLNY